MSPDVSDDEREMTIERSLHTKFASSRRLLVEMREMVGKGHFKIEMRHNVYNIRASKDFDLNLLLQNCQRIRQGQTVRTDQNRVSVTSIASS